MTGGERSPGEIVVAPDTNAFARMAAEQITAAAVDAIAASGRFTIALAEGNTPRAIYHLLVEDELARQIDWARVQLFWGDERCVPPDDPESNYRMVQEALLDHVPLPAANIHRMHGEEEPVRAAAAYGRTLQSAFGGDAAGGPPSAGFDFVLLGMGGDGHTASLFPGQSAVRERERWVLAEYVNAVSLWRITLTPVLLNAAANVTFAVAGADKAETLRAVIEGPYQPDRLPYA